MVSHFDEIIQPEGTGKQGAEIKIVVRGWTELHNGGLLHLYLWRTATAGPIRWPRGIRRGSGNAGSNSAGSTVVSAVYCQVMVSAAGWALFQRSDLETLK